MIPEPHQVDARVATGGAPGPALAIGGRPVLAVGDSSGGVFIKDPADNVWKLAGINWALDASYSTSSGSGFFSGALFDRGGFYQNGQLVTDTTADNPQRAWASRIGDTTNTAFINSVTSAPVWVGLSGGMSTPWIRGISIPIRSQRTEIRRETEKHFEVRNGVVRTSAPCPLISGVSPAAACGAGRSR